MINRLSDDIGARHEQLATLFQPLGVLIEHRVDDVDEGLIAVDQSMPAAQNVTLEPSFHRVLAEHLHNSTVRCKLPAVSIFRKVLAEPDLLTNFIDGLELVGLCLVWPEDPEVLHVSPHHFPEKIAEVGDATGHGLAGFLDFNTGSCGNPACPVACVPSHHSRWGWRSSADDPSAPGPSTRE